MKLLIMILIILNIVRKKMNKTFIKNLNIFMDYNIKLEIYNYSKNKIFKNYVSFTNQRKDLFYFKFENNEIVNEFPDNLKKWTIKSIKMIEKNFKISFYQGLIMYFLPFCGISPHKDDHETRKYIFAWPVLPLNNINFSPLYILKKHINEYETEEINEIKNNNILDIDEYYEKVEYNDFGIMFNAQTYHYVHNNEYFRMSFQLNFI